MKRQTSLDSYINRKTGSLLIASTPTMSEKKNKKKSRSLGSVSTEEKVLNVKKEEIVVDLCSDDENTSHTEQPMLDRSNSQSSNSTVDYSFTPTTPNKYLKASPSSSSPKSAKFFSPKKNRAVFKKSPVKRNLALQFYKQPEVKNDVENVKLNQACKDMDDKTIFLLTTIDKCINDDRLKALLDENMVLLLNQSFTVLKPGMRLVCRLYWRQDKWYKIENLIDIINDRKQDIPYPIFTEILRCLVENGFIEPSGNSTMDFESLAKTLKVDEMQQLVKELKLKPPSKSKQDMEIALKNYSKQKPISNFFKLKLLDASNNTERVLHLMRSKVGVCYQLTAAARCALDKLYLLVYLGISYQTIREKKLELMLINDKSKLETYPVDKAMPLDSPTDIFANKQEFDRYWAAHIIHEDYIKQSDTAEKCSIVIKVFKLFKDVPDTDMMRYASLPPWLRRFTPPYLYARILTSGVEELKKDAAHHQLAVDILTALLAQDLFVQHKKGLWYAEKALVLHKLLRQQEEAAAVLIQGLTSNLPEELKDAMRPRAKIIAGRLNAPVSQERRQTLLDCGVQTMVLENSFPAEHIAKQHMETATRGKRKFKVDTENQRMVMDAENYCLLEYTTNRDFTHGGHWEGRIITTIYILLFWDIIYSKPPGVVGTFLSHYQLFPLDMKSGENFYENRKAAIEERLLEIEGMSTPELQQRMKYKWDERPECELSDIARHIEWDNVSMVVSCLGPRAVAALCRRLASNYGHAHSGFPDLTLWNVHTRKIKFVEVKTDSDKPSVKQLQWMRYLRDHGVDVGFCYLGAASTRNRARAAPSDVPT